MVVGREVAVSAAEGTAVKRFGRGASADRYAYERRVNALLNRHAPPVPAPRLLRAHRSRRELVFAAVDGDVLGPKFPTALSDEDVDGLLALACAMATFRPRARWLRRLPIVRPGTVAAATFRAVHDALGAPMWTFAHGDITARNVMRRASDGALVLIDWEWAGVYPRGWELAFLWYALADVPGARRRVASSVAGRDLPWFWASALVIAEVHLSLPGLAPGTPFRAAHVATRDSLRERYDWHCSQ